MYARASHAAVFKSNGFLSYKLTPGMSACSAALPLFPLSLRVHLSIASIAHFYSFRDTSYSPNSNYNVVASCTDMAVYSTGGRPSNSHRDTAEENQLTRAALQSSGVCLATIRKTRQKTGNGLSALGVVISFSTTGYHRKAFSTVKGFALLRHRFRTLRAGFTSTVGRSRHPGGIP